MNNNCNRYNNKCETSFSTIPCTYSYTTTQQTHILSNKLRQHSLSIPFSVVTNVCMPSWSLQCVSRLTGVTKCLPIPHHNPQLPYFKSQCHKPDRTNHKCNQRWLHSTSSQRQNTQTNCTHPVVHTMPPGGSTTPPPPHSSLPSWTQVRICRHQ